MSLAEHNAQVALPPATGNGSVAEDTPNVPAPVRRKIVGKSSGTSAVAVLDAQLDHSGGAAEQQQDGQRPTTEQFLSLGSAFQGLVALPGQCKKGSAPPPSQSPKLYMGTSQDMVSLGTLLFMSVSA